MFKCNCPESKLIVKELTRPGLTLKISYDPQCYQFQLVGRIPGQSTIEYVAPAPMPLGYSQSQGALPFPSRLIAYENTPNQGLVQADGEGFFTIHLNAPGAYFSRQGSQMILPELVLTAGHQMFIVSLIDHWYNNHHSIRRYLSR